MKKKMFLVGTFTIVAMSGYFFYQANSQSTISHLVLDNIEALSQDESGPIICTAMANCYDKLHDKIGEISCSGRVKCTSQFMKVICDEVEHVCKFR